MLYQLGPRVLVTAVLMFLFLASASGVAQTTALPGSNLGLPAVSPRVFPVQNHSLSLVSEPLWDRGDWERKKKKPPVGVPEGGSEATYLALTGLACLFAIGFSQRQKSQ